MKYEQGQINRVFVIKFEHGDNLLQELQHFLVKEEIKTGFLLMIGALKKSDMIVGPKECVVPPIGIPLSFDDGREIAAIGTIFPDENNHPVFHIHSSVGRENTSVIGCIRDNTEVYLIVEAIVIEIANVNAHRVFNKEFNLKVLNIT